MAIILFRVDERLIHGQVVIGWGNQLRPDRYLVVDEKLALSDWEQDLYRLGAAGAEVEFVAPEVARENLEAWRLDTARSILLTKEVSAMGRLAEGGLMIGEKVNLGGVHHGPGREEFLTYLHLTEDEISELEKMNSAGVEVTARDLPDTHRVSLETLLKSKWKYS